jgi:hypothetical protein
MREPVIAVLHYDEPLVKKLIPDFWEPLVQEVTLFTNKKTWEFPSDPFVEYEESDERWARPLGFGKEVNTPTTLTAPCTYADLGVKVVEGQIETSINLMLLGQWEQGE